MRSARWIGVWIACATVAFACSESGGSGSEGGGGPGGAASEGPGSGSGASSASSTGGDGNTQGSEVNLEPHCQASLFSTEAGAPLLLDLQVVDPEGTPTSAEILEQPEHGSLEGTPPLLTYTPDAGFVGTDRFTFTATDQDGAACEPAVVSLRIVALPGEELQLPSTLEATVTVGEQEYELKLGRHSMRSPNFKLFTYDEARTPKIQEVTALPEPRTYRGRVVDHPELVASAAVDESGTLHASLWNGRRRIGGGTVSVSEALLVPSPAVATVAPRESLLSGTIPEVENNQLYLPERGADFHSFLARVRTLYLNEEFDAKAGGSLVDGVTHIESLLNETDHLVLQKVGLRYESAISLIEINGSAPEPVAWPDTVDETNFSLTLAPQLSPSALCSGGHRKLRCRANFWMENGWPHELGHTLNLQHVEGQVDSMFHVMDGRPTSTEITLMQSRKALGRLQSDSDYFKAEPPTTPMLPAAFFDYVTLRAGESVVFDPLANDFDANGDVLGIARFDATTFRGGTVQRAGARLEYTPPEGFVGADMFSYTATDGALETSQTIHVMVLPDDLAGHWPVDPTADTLVDVSGQGLDMTLKRGTFAEALVTGPDGEMSALSEPAHASNELVEDAFGSDILPHVFDPGDASFSASIWFKYTKSTDAHPRIIFAKSTTGVEEYAPTLFGGPNSIREGGWEIRADGLDLVFEVGFKNRRAAEHVFQVVHEGAIEEGTWHHAALVIDREEHELRGYLDGVPLTVALPENGGPIVASMTKRARDGGAHFSGYGSPLLVGNHTREKSGTSAYADPRIHHRVLSPEEIAALVAME